MQDKKIIRLCRDSTYVLDDKEYTLPDAVRYLVVQCGFSDPGWSAAEYLESLSMEMETAEFTAMMKRVGS